MVKIKEIHERLLKNPREYTELRFLIAQRIFILAVTAYFTSLLFTIGGFYIGSLIGISTLGMITYHLYSLLVVAVVWFGFSIAEYFVAIYFPQKSWIAYIVLAIFMMFGGYALFLHLGPAFLN